MRGQRFSFGPFLLNPDNGTLLRKGAIVTKAELMDAAWPGAAVEESNLSVQIALLRKAIALAADGEEWTSSHIVCSRLET